MARNIKIFHDSLVDHLIYSLGKDVYSATARDKYAAVVLSVREQLIENWMRTQQHYYEVDAKRVYYLSLEFLLGRLLRSYVTNLGLPADYSRSVDVLGLTYEELIEHEWDAGLGNGGLGRLAACYLDSLATLQYPAYGYGIRYEYGIFTQKIREGFQIEFPENWLRYGNPWEFPRPEVICPVHFHGRVNTIHGGSGKFRMEWIDTDDVMAMAYDYPVPGYHNDTVNTLRLWSARSSREFNLDYFNSGDYFKAVEDKTHSETISKILYPTDHTLAGKELRLKQQYFFVSATIRDIIRRFKKFHADFTVFPRKVAMQLNDTHPAIAIAELMRILIDEDSVHWDIAWEITTKTFAYTNHTVLPEALETWSEGLMGYLLPRHLQIIREIDRRFQIQVSHRFPDEPHRGDSMAILTSNGERWVNMARLAIIGSHAVNGVSRLHTEILRQSVFSDFTALTPQKFVNVTNGITPRRWLLEANPGLARLITDAIGEKWVTDTEELQRLEPFVEDTAFRERFTAIKEMNKVSLSKHLEQKIGVPIPSDFLLDCQVKRFHEYKRQLLNVLHVMTLYNRIKEGRTVEAIVPRTVLFAGKAAPGYWLCKLIIKLIHNVDEVIKAQPAVRDRLKVVFVPNYSVSLAQRIIPAAELSEQISTAGFEASGTGNMKFTMNGALTIGTLDGANVEIREEVGPENFFLFGLTAEEISELRLGYNPHRIYEQNPELRQVIDQISEGHFSPEDRNLFKPITDTLLNRDYFFVLADYAAYVTAQNEVARTYLDRDRWAKTAVLNVARSGKFSSDRAIKEYAEKIWGLSPQTI